jgi:hypothetical protein
MKVSQDESERNWKTKLKVVVNSITEGGQNGRYVALLQGNILYKILLKNLCL